MAQYEFEDAMTLIADPNDQARKPFNRFDIVGAGGGSTDNSATGTPSGGDASAEWLINQGVYSQLKSAGSPVHNHWDVYWWGSHADYTVLVGANLNEAWWFDQGSPWQNFISGSPAIMSRILAAPWQTPVFSPNSMQYGAETLLDTSNLLSAWYQAITIWADGVDVPGSDFQGSAAGVFKNVLTQFAAQMNALITQLTPSTVVQTLDAVGGKMTSAVQSLSDAFSNWTSDPGNLPTTIIARTLANAMQGATMHVHGTHIRVLTADNLDVGGDVFWNNVEQAAKSAWVATLQPLDDAAGTFFATLDTAYQGTINVMQTTFVPPVNMAAAATGDPGGLDAGGLGALGLGGGGGTLDLGSGGGGIGQADFGLAGTGVGASGLGPGGGPLGLGGSGSGAGLSLAGGTGPGDPGAGGGAVDLGLTGGSGAGRNLTPPGVGAQDFALTGGGAGTGPGGSTTPDTVDGPNGLPLLDSSGDPLTVPPGSTIGPEGAVVGPDGKPVLGPNGKPLTVPPGSTLSQDDSLLGPGGQALVGPDGQPLSVPAGSSIGPNGTVVGPNGRLVVGPDGKPLSVPPGATIAPPRTAGDTTVPLTGGGSVSLGPGGSLSAGVADAAGNVGAALGGSAIGGGGQLGLDRASGLGSGFGRGLSIGGGGGGPDSGGGFGAASSASRFLSTGTGLSGRAQGIGEPGGGEEPGPASPGGEDASGLAAAENAAEEGQMLGRVATVGGGGAASSGEEPPMMPPMSGGMGGAGGAASGAKKTWVTEDEDTWGTTSALGAGVIGR